MAKFYIRPGYTFIVGKNKVLHELDEKGNRVVIDEKVYKIEGQEMKLEPVEKPKPAEKMYSIALISSIIAKAALSHDEDSAKEMDPLFSAVNKALESQGLQLGIVSLDAGEDVTTIDDVVKALWFFGSGNLSTDSASQKIIAELETKLSEALGEKGRYTISIIDSAEKRYTFSEVAKLILSATIDINSDAIIELTGLMNPVNEALRGKGLELSVSQLRKKEEVKVDQPAVEPKPVQPAGTGEKSTGAATQNAPVSGKVEQPKPSADKITVSAPKKS